MIEYGRWLQEQLGHKCQKIAIDAGFTCPNRDGHLGTGGCTFCSNTAFNPRYCNPLKSVTTQLEEGKVFFNKKFNKLKYIAYFQAYTGTYADDKQCIHLYEEALSVKDICGIIIATRPDCMSPQLLDYLARLRKRTFVMIEYGVESANDQTLLRINRGHDFSTCQRKICETAALGIPVGAHIILGLPGEDRKEVLRQARLIAQLPLSAIKLHQLQIIRGTALAKEYEQNPWPMPSAQEYVRLAADYLSLFPQDMAVDRIVSSIPPDMLVAPRWGLKNHEITEMLREIWTELTNNSK